MSLTEEHKQALDNEIRVLTSIVERGNTWMVHADAGEFDKELNAHIEIEKSRQALVNHSRHLDIMLQVRNGKTLKADDVDFLKKRVEWLRELIETQTRNSIDPFSDPKNKGENPLIIKRYARIAEQNAAQLAGRLALYEACLSKYAQAA